MKQFGFRQGKSDPRRRHEPARQEGRPIFIGKRDGPMSPREWRDLAWRADPHCHWCKKPTRLPPPRVKGVKHRQEHDWATIDHLVSRFRKHERGAHQPGERRWVLACYECNQRRATEEQASVPIEELRARASKSRR
jgi:hypothetical protein